MALDIGIDLSFYQDKNETPNISMDFEKAKLVGVKFAFIKASQALYKDPDFDTYKVNVKKSGLPFGFYHFLVWSISGKAQANYYWNLVKDTGFNLPMVCDFERNPGVVTPPNAKYILKDFLEELKRLSGNKPILIYTNMFFWKENGDKDDYWKQYGLWGASYSNQLYFEENMRNFTPWDEWVFWQYTDKGDGLKYGAESLNIDMNYLNGSIEDFLAQLSPVNTVDECKELILALEAENQRLVKILEGIKTLVN